MKQILLLITLIFFACNDKGADHPCMSFMQNIESQENEIERLFQEEGKLKEQLESAYLYIKTLEYEKQELLKIVNNPK